MGEGNFGGDGSVRWRIRTRADKAKANNDSNLGGPRPNRFGGADDDHGSYYKIKLRKPTGPVSIEAFKTQLIAGISTETIQNVEYVVLTLTIEAPEKTERQVIVDWDKPGTQLGPAGTTRPSSTTTKAGKRR